jgi:hypothetical protein
METPTRTPTTTKITPKCCLFQGDTIKLLDNIYISHLVKRGRAAIERKGEESWENCAYNAYRGWGQSRKLASEEIEMNGHSWFSLNFHLTKLSKVALQVL